MITLLSVNAGTSIQDAGRPGWKRFGVPAGGAMDADSARWANLLVGNEPEAPVLEILLGQCRWQVEAVCTLAIAGADVATDRAAWRSFSAQPGDVIALHGARHGVWSYLATAGGFSAPLFFGSASVNTRAGLGEALKAGQQLSAQPSTIPSSIAGRFLPEKERPIFASTLEVPFWPGPEWADLSQSDQEIFLATSWRISNRSDRAGYRIEGPALGENLTGILSAPVTVGTVQLPPGGMPLVVMRDGPTVGGYPRLGMVDPKALSRFAQQAPGTGVNFTLLT